MLINFTGRSDDLLYVGPPTCEEEFNIYDDDIVASIYVTQGGNTALVYAIYDGCWSFSLGQECQGDNLDFITEAIHYTDHDYCIGLELHVPEDTKLAVYYSNKELLALWSDAKGWQYD